MDNLFDSSETASEAPRPPLAERMRPKNLGEVLGPDDLVGPKGFLTALATAGLPPSLILWGPPGSGKTSIARLLAELLDCDFETMSAVLSGVADVRKVVAKAASTRVRGRRTMLFVDEIHRFNKAQQDAFLPHVENGTIVLVGATTENPSFEVIPALLSRCRVIRLPSLSKEQLRTIAERAATDPHRGLADDCTGFTNDAISAVCELASGDARSLLNLMEIAAGLVGTSGTVGPDTVKLAARTRTHPHDKLGDAHYNLISAFHKSLRGSDPDAALHYYARMVAGGENPLFIIRRMFNFASEDIGNADPQAIQIVASALAAYNFMGDPEGLLPVAQAVIYLATAPKSNASYRAWKEAQADVEELPTQPVPEHLVNAPTSLMKQLGFGHGYRYPHDYQYSYVAEEYLPAGLKGRKYYWPSETGFEREIRKRLAFWGRLKAAGHQAKKTPET